MGEIPLDAARALDELRDLKDEPWAGPRSWLSPELFDAALASAPSPPAVLDEDLAWLHAHWSLAKGMEEGGDGAKGRLRRRLARALLAPFLGQIEQYMATNVRTVDALARRVDELEASHLRVLGAVRHDFVALARYLEERLDEGR